MRSIAVDVDESSICAACERWSSLKAQLIAPDPGSPRRTCALPIAGVLLRSKFYFALYDGTNLPASLHISTCHAVTCGWPSLARMALHSAWRAAHRATAPHATRGSDMSHGEAKGFMTPVGPAAMIRTTYVLEPRAHRTLCPYQNRAASCATRGQHQLHLPLA